MWQLDPDIQQLNHGSFGACPTPVLEEQQRWRDLLEANPTHFVDEIYYDALDTARNALSGFIGADPSGVVFVPNATTGVNAVLLSLEPQLTPGDEILLTDHTYNACRNAVDVTCERTGATAVIAPIPFPIDHEDTIVEAVLSRVTPNTRLFLVDGVTSPTAIVMPIQRLVDALEPDVSVLVDAAHSPGMLPLTLDATGASFTTGNCHKWMCTPKGAAFLHVRADHHPVMRPTTISHGWNAETRPEHSRLHELFDFVGTDDPSARLSIPSAIETVSTLHDDGWPGVMTANRELALTGRDVVCGALGVTPPAPDELLGSMASILVSSEPGPGMLDPLTKTLYAKWHTQVPVFNGPGGRIVRISAQRYNTIDQYELLAAALVDELGV